MRISLIFVSIGLFAACAAQQSPKAARPHATAAIDALQKADFSSAYAHASDALSFDSSSSSAAAIRALARYVKVMSTFRANFIGVVESAGRENGFDHVRMRTSMTQTQKALGEIDQDLKVAAQDKLFSLELCLACWERDWNHNGRIDNGDRNLFQIEIDANGEELPEGDVRRKPTFRFDVGDIHWARAMVAFQRAAFELVLAYRWTELDKLLGSFSRFGGGPPVITIHIGEAARVRHAQKLILKGLKHAGRSRKAYLREQDDDHEWVPNPVQKNHPLPLPVDQALFETWKRVLGDLERLVKGETGISAREVAQMGDHQWKSPPLGYIDIGKMLSQPKSIAFDFPGLRDIPSVDDEPNIEKILQSILGGYYVKKMKSTKLIRRLRRMKNEMDRNEDTLERKLRYLLWLN